MDRVDVKEERVCQSARDREQFLPQEIGWMVGIVATEIRLKFPLLAWKW
jgi:hypothetical protein